MKTLFKYLIPAALTLVVAAACADHRSDDLEDFQTMVYFRNGGEQELALYRTGEDGIYKIPICKSGRNLEGTTSAVLIPFDEAQLAIYNITKESSYALIPPSCYTFLDENGTPLSDQSSVSLEFGPSDPYKVITISVNTNAVSALQEKNEDATYVLAFELFSPGKVSADINCIVLKPEIDIPLLSLLSPGVDSYQYSGTSKMSESYKNTISLNMEENRWDFTCTLEVKDAKWLEDYNTSKGKNYTLLPASMYSLSSKEVRFAPGETEASFEVTVNREGMEMLTEYAIPVMLSACSKQEFKIDGKSNLYLLNVRLDPDGVTITEDMISVSSQHPGDGDGAPALIDGDVTTYWHTLWSTHNGDPVFGEYVDIALKTPLKAIVFTYCTRSQNANGIPVCVAVYARNEESEEWIQLGEDLETEEMATAGAGTWVTLPVLKSEKSFRYIRFAVLKASPTESGDLRLQGTKHFTSLSELQLKGSN